MAQQLQRMRAAAFPEDRAQEEAERQRLIANAREQARTEPKSSPALSPPQESDQSAVEGQKSDKAMMGAAAHHAPTVKKSGRKPNVFYRSCSAARMAGAAPIRRGSPGYGRHLDRDGDGIACE